MTNLVPAKDPTRNVWLQLGLPDAEEHYVKAELVLRPADRPRSIRQPFESSRAIKTLKLTQRAAARRIDATQPELSKILGGKFAEVSIARLIQFLTALG